VIDLADIFPRAAWRVIIHPPMDGATNMAIDEAISESVGAGQSPSTLRFYAWQPGCLSLGFAQQAADVDFERLREYGWECVRRLTGGRAILHIDEATYSICTPLDDPRVSGGVIESYRRLSMGLLAGLQELGASVAAQPRANGMPSDSGPICFEVPSNYEITAQGRKLLGSAQARRKKVVLQHGALPLQGDLGRICEVLVFGTDSERQRARARVTIRAITLEEALGYRVGLAQVVGMLMEGLSHTLNLDLHEAGLSPVEQQRADELREIRYASDEWTLRL
jgi:lipoate-protein ligase A